MNLDSFIDELAITEPVGGPFTNPYMAKHCRPDMDVPDAAELRIRNAKAYFGAIEMRPKALLLGESPGFHGCRFSGAAFTSERQLVERRVPFKGVRTSRFERPETESSATIVWGVVKEHWPSVVLHNTLPWHPYQVGLPRSNRTPTPTEVNAGLPILQVFIDRVKPRVVVAVGKKAEGALQQLGVAFRPARHPANGGASQFRLDVEAILGKRTKQEVLT